MPRWLWVFFLVGPSTALAQYDVIDDLHRTVHFERPPQRVVTLLPSLTETVCALGACSRLVGTDRHSDWPGSVATLPKLGGLDEAQVELIVRLHPDVVLLSNAERVTARLGALGVPTFAVTSESYRDIAHGVRVVAQVLGVAEAGHRLNARIEGEVAAISQAARARRGALAGPRVYFEVDPTPYAAGTGSFIGELLSRLGARNIVTPDLGPFPKLNPEYVVRQDPDVIFAARPAAASLAQRPGWAGIRAVREQRVCVLDKQANDTVVRPGPRVAEGMRALDACLDRVAP